MGRAWLALVLLTACGGPEPEEDACFVEAAAEPLATCLPRSLHPDTDPASPGYGRVPCVIIASASRGTPFCDCATPGLAPASDEQKALARDELEASGNCRGACCDDQCFCQFVQLSGPDLAYCQGTSDMEYPDGEWPRGWCYVEPGAGVGDPSTITECPTTEPQKILFLPPDGPLVHGFLFLSCIG